MAAVEAADGVAGMAFFHRASDVSPGGPIGYLQYLVIAPERRGGGLGAAAYRAVRDAVRPASRLILEVEDPDRCEAGESRDTAARRIRFYERLGLRLVDAPYVQPPASPGLPPWPMRLMVDADPYAPPLADADLAAAFQAWMERF